MVFLHRVLPVRCASQWQHSLLPEFSDYSLFAFPLNLCRAHCRRNGRCRISRGRPLRLRLFRLRRLQLLLLRLGLMWLRLGMLVLRVIVILQFRLLRLLLRLLRLLPSTRRSLRRGG